jgi:hypothetical protein
MSRHQICHAHCPKGGGGGVLVILLIAAIVAIATAARAAAPAIGHAVRLAVDAVEIGLIAAASLTALALAGWMASAAMRARASRAIEQQALPRHALTVQRAAEAISAPQPLAIEAPKPALADLKAMAAEHGYDMVARQASED